MELSLRNCDRCNRLFAPPSGKETSCEDCMMADEDALALIQTAIERHGLRDVATIATRTGLPPGRVDRLVRDSSLLAFEVDERGTCERCKVHPAQPDSRFCLNCRLELHGLLKSARIESSATVGLPKYPAHPEMSELSARDALETKRQRTGSHRFNPAPSQRKGYR